MTNDARNMSQCHDPYLAFPKCAATAPLASFRGKFASQEGVADSGRGLRSGRTGRNRENKASEPLKWAPEPFE